MVFISNSDTPENIRKEMSTNNMILLTPEFFACNVPKPQFEDALTVNHKAIRESINLVPPTPEGLALLTPSNHQRTAELSGPPDLLSVVPFSQSVHNPSNQLLPLKQSLAYGAVPKNTSYLCISHSQVPLGIFWDVENVRLPKNKSPAAVIEAIRQKFLTHYREAEFLVVCDAFKERKSLLMDFNSAQVTVVHVPCISKNAADDKLRQCMRRFVDNAGTPCAVMLISSDVNFSVDLSDYKNRKKIHVILLHGPLASEALMLSSNEHYLFDDLIEQVPSTPQNKVILKTSVYLEVTNLPLNAPELMIRQRLERIGENCGGKVVELQRNRGVIRFTSTSAAERALLRMNGEDVYGRKITLQKMNDNSKPVEKRSNFPPPPNPAKVAPPTLLAFPSNPKHCLDSSVNDSYHRQFYCCSNEQVYRHTSESSEDDHRRNTSSDEVSPHPSSDYDEENERPEKDVNQHIQKDCDSFIRNRSRVKTLVVNIPQKSLPFHIFSELFNLSFKCTISLDDLKKMSDLLLVTDDGRAPVLFFKKIQHKTNDTNKPRDNSHFKEARPRCPIHDKSIETKDEELLFVCTGLTNFGVNILTLLKSHGGAIPLVSLPKCYASEFGALNFDEEEGVPIEQLLAFVKGVTIVSVKDFKLVQTKDDDDKDPKASWNPLLITQLNILSNEMVDLLKAAPLNRMPFNHFNGAYFDHFSRHCKVSDYGFSRLVDLLEAMPHVVQVIGEGSHRYLTLSHHIQINRFRSDMLKVLKGQGNKVSLKFFDRAYETTIGKRFKAQNYCLCKLEDLLSCLVETKTVVIKNIDGELSIAIPKKELTQEQLAKIKQFAVEVLKLLKGAPKNAMEFSKFIPAYHVQFGKQCRLANYGCSKLVELFEHISDIVEVTDIENSTEKLVRLKLSLRMVNLGQQMTELIKKRPGQLSVLVDSLPDVFRLNYGYFLDPRDFDCLNIYELLDKLQNYVEVVHSNLGDELRLSGRYMAPIEKIRVFKILCNAQNGPMSLDEMLEEYKANYADDCQLNFVSVDESEDLFLVEGEEKNFIKLSPTGELARQLLVLITEKGGKVPFEELDKQFFERFDYHITPSKYGHDSLVSILASLSQIITIRGKGSKKGVFVSQYVIDLFKSGNTAKKKNEANSTKESSSENDA